MRTATELSQADLEELVLYIRDDRIILKAEKPIKAIVEGLVLPDSVKDDQFDESPFYAGRVMMVGPGMAVQGDPEKRYPMEVQPGDRVLYHKAAAERNRLFIQGNILHVIGNRDISMKISEEAEVVQVIHKRGTG